jgi:polysaccharide pyruvyl transferase WcaK-like protein
MVRRAKKVGILDHLGGGNLGDDATQAAVMCNLRRRWPDCEIVGFSMNPSDTRSRHGIPSYPIRRETWDINYRPPKESGVHANAETAPVKRHALRRVASRIKAAFRGPTEAVPELFFLIRSFRLMRSFDVLIIGGGGQLLDSWGGPWKFPYTLFKWVSLAKLSKAKCYFMSVGAGPLEHGLSKTFIRYALRLADYVSFRDEKSRALAVRAGFTGDAQVWPDCVYSLDVPAAAPRDRETQPAPLVGVSPMAYCDPRHYYIQDLNVYKAFVQKLALFGSWLSRDHRLTLFSTDISFDADTIEDLNGALKGEPGMDWSSLLTREPIVGIESLLSQMSCLDYIVTCRFHGVIFAHLKNIPVIAISHHPKVATLMTDIGLSEYCLDIHTFDTKQLVETFTRLVNNKVSIKARMAETLSRYKSSLTGHFDQLFPLEEAV